MASIAACKLIAWMMTQAWVAAAAAAGGSPPTEPPLLLRTGSQHVAAPPSSSSDNATALHGSMTMGNSTANKTAQTSATAAAQKVAGASLIVSVRLTDCDWPPGRSLERAATAMAATTHGGGGGGGDGAAGSSSGVLQGTSPVARAQVLCVYEEARRIQQQQQQQQQQQARPTAVRRLKPADVPSVVTVAGVPLAHCALGASLGLQYVLALGRGALPGAPLRVLSSTPIVGGARSVARQLGGAVAERFCLVDPKPRRSWRRDWRRRRSLLQEGQAGGGEEQQQQTQPSAEGAQRCGLSPDAGPCGGSLRRWFYDGARGACRRFTYSGCGGNANNFLAAADCAAACPLTPPPVRGALNPAPVMD